MQGAVIQRSVTAVGLGLLMLAHSAFARTAVDGDREGNRPRHKITVKETLDSRQPGKTVEISGVIIRQVGPNTVLMHDGTAAIEVDIPQEQIPPGGLRSNLRIRIRGEVVAEDEGDKEVNANQAFWSF